MEENDYQIVDQEAYKLYEDLKKHPATQEENRWYYSDNDPELKLNTDNPSFQSLIGHLPKEEQVKIKELVSKRRSVRAQTRVAKEKAYGIKRHGTTLAKPKVFIGDEVDKYRTKLLDLFGSFHTVDQVKRIAETKWKVFFTNKVLKDFVEGFSKTIQEKQDLYRNDISSLRLTYKAARVEELTELFYHRKAIWQKTDSPKDHRLMLETLKMVKAEVEGDVTMTINGNIEHTFQQAIDVHVYQNLLSQIPINDMVLARASAKMDLPVNLLMNRLHNSYYSRFAGFTRISKVMNVEEIPHPSAAIFDFQMINQNNQKIVDADVKVIEEHRSPEDSLSKDDSLRQKLLKQTLLNKIKQRKDGSPT